MNQKKDSKTITWANITFSVSAEIDEPDTVCIDGGISTETLESLQRTANKIKHQVETEKGNKFSSFEVVDYYKLHNHYTLKVECSPDPKQYLYIDLLSGILMDIEEDDTN